MISENYKSFRIDVDVTETPEGFVGRWEVMQQISNGWNGIKAEKIAFPPGPSQGEVTVMCVKAAKAYVDSL